MRNHPVRVTFILCLFASLAGCANFKQSAIGQVFYGKTPGDKVAAAEKTFNSVNDAIGSAVQGGLITDKNFIRGWKETQVDLAAGLHVAKAYADSGAQAAFDQAWPQITAKLNKFVADYAAAQSAKHPSTQPALSQTENPPWTRSPLPSRYSPAFCPQPQRLRQTA